MPSPRSKPWAEMNKYERMVDEFRISKTGDPWGEVMGWLFALADYLTYRKIEVPAEWEFKQSPYGADKSAWEFQALRSIRAEKKNLLKFGKVLWRLRSRVKSAGRDY